MNPAWLPGGKDYRPANGPGEHGPAKGSANRGEKQPAFSTQNQPDPAVISAGKNAKAAMIARLSAKWESLEGRLVGLAENAVSEQIQYAALKEIKNTLFGTPVQAISGPEGEPLPNVMNVRFVKPE